MTCNIPIHYNIDVSFLFGRVEYIRVGLGRSRFQRKYARRIYVDMAQLAFGWSDATVIEGVLFESSLLRHNSACALGV